MRFSLIILTSLLASSWFFACKNNDIPNRLDENIPAYLDSISPYMKDFANSTDTIYNISFHEDRHLLSIVGKIIDGKEIYALHYCEKDTLLNFYHFKELKKGWEHIGSDRPAWDMVYDFDLEDLDGDTKNEIITYSFPNMNGNTCKDIFYLSKNNGSIHIAGTFFSSTYIANTKNQTLETDYGGSWYMPLVKTLYQWHDEHLIAAKALELELKEGNMESDDRLLSYYENTSLKSDSIIDSLTLIHKVPFIEKEHRLLWDNFLEQHNKYQISN